MNIPDDRGAYVAGFGAATVLAIAALGVGVNGLAYVPAILTLFGGGFFLLTWLVSAQEVARDAIVVGEQLRPFTALDEFGEATASGTESITVTGPSTVNSRYAQARSTSGTPTSSYTRIFHDGSWHSAAQSNTRGAAPRTATAPYRNRPRPLGSSSRPARSSIHDPSVLPS